MLPGLSSGIPSGYHYEPPLFYHTFICFLLKCPLSALSASLSASIFYSPYTFRVWGFFIAAGSGICLQKEVILCIITETMAVETADATKETIITHILTMVVMDMVTTVDMVHQSY